MIIKTLLPLLLVFGGRAFSQDLIRETMSVYQLLKSENYHALHKRMDESLKEFIPKKRLKKSLSGMITAFGEVQKIGPIHLDTAEGRTGTHCDIYLEKNTLNMILEFSGKELHRFQITPHSYSFPTAAQNIVFGKKALTIRTDTFELPAELIFPITSQPAPVVIIVHGSGPMDMNGTVGPNKVYQDLALELALRGIATLRYDKRSKVYPDNFGKKQTFTFKEETIDDVGSAIEQLKNTVEIDTGRIYVLGHSLGGYLAPKIGQLYPDISGLILMAAPHDPLYKLIPEQLDYLFSLQTKQKWIYKYVVKKARKESQLLSEKRYKKVKNPKLATAYWPVSYIQDLEDYRPADVLNALHSPALILQGKRDYQVPWQGQFTAFVEQCGTNPRVTFQDFESLNHLFIPGDGKPTNLEYYKSGHLDPEVADVIASWIKGQ